MLQPKMNIELPAERIAAFCRKWQITELAVFGSVLRDDFRADSDLDVLITPGQDARWSAFDMMHMGEELAEIAGRPVDVVSRRGLDSSRNFLRRQAILESARTIYAARQPSVPVL
ncbi:MAG TPA: nucleotidyltransferase domain-containing protein [Tepidiformaceae bacterium]|nr:nucleotidyltransferase domain-containing protein [Tepidiformaceae bacterium]